MELRSDRRAAGGQGCLFFAVPEEARPFQRHLARVNASIKGGTARVTPPRVVISGMGAANAGQAFRDSLTCGPAPDWLLTCGFAGGLDPQLAAGTLIFDADEGHPLTGLLEQAGARRVRFHCAERVAITVEEKQRLRQSTGADAVEMESGVIRRLARAQGWTAATVRVVSDAALEPLPLDFNALMTPQMRLSAWRLAAHLTMSPRTIPGLIRLGRRTQWAAQRLAELLVTLIR